MNILAFTNMTASYKWRLSPVADRLNMKTDHAMYVTPYNTWNENVMEADIVVFEMLASPASVEICHKQGAKVIYEADDAVIDSYGRERKNLQHMGEKHREDAIETIRLCDAVTVTNERLKQNFARFTDKPIYVLPNYVDLDWYGKEEVHARRNTGEIRLGWFGSKGHFEDLRALIPVLAEVLEKYPQVKLIYCGYGGASSDKASTEIMSGEDVFRGIPPDRREFILPVNEDMWPIKHRLLDLDIGIAPLIDDEFNHCKTPIKWMEYGLLGTPAVCSSVLYDKTVRHGVDGLLCHNDEEWKHNLSMLIEGETLRQQIGNAARSRVINEFNAEDHWQEWIKVYESVLQS